MTIIINQRPIILRFFYKLKLLPFSIEYIFNMSQKHITDIFIFF